MSYSNNATYNLHSFQGATTMAPEPSAPPTYYELLAQRQKDQEYIRQLEHKIVMLEDQLYEQQDELDVLEWQTDVQNKILSTSLSPACQGLALNSTDMVHPNKFANLSHDHRVASIMHSFKF